MRRIILLLAVLMLGSLVLLGCIPEGTEERPDDTHPEVGMLISYRVDGKTETVSITDKDSGQCGIDPCLWIKGPISNLYIIYSGQDPEGMQQLYAETCWYYVEDDPDEPREMLAIDMDSDIDTWTRIGTMFPCIWIEMLALAIDMDSDNVSFYVVSSIQQGLHQVVRHDSIKTSTGQVALIGAISPEWEEDQGRLLNLDIFAVNRAGLTTKARVHFWYRLPVFVEEAIQIP